MSDSLQDRTTRETAAPLKDAADTWLAMAMLWLIPVLAFVLTMTRI